MCELLCSMSLAYLITVTSRRSTTGLVGIGPKMETIFSETIWSQCVGWWKMLGTGGSMALMACRVLPSSPVFSFPPPGRIPAGFSWDAPALQAAFGKGTWDLLAVPILSPKNSKSLPAAGICFFTIFCISFPLNVNWLHGAHLPQLLGSFRGICLPSPSIPCFPGDFQGSRR